MPIIKGETIQDAELRKAVKKLKPKALFDHRYPLMGEESFSMGVTTIVKFFAALQTWRLSVRVWRGLKWGGIAGR